MMPASKTHPFVLAVLDSLLSLLGYWFLVRLPWRKFKPMQK